MLCGAECESVVHVLWECSAYSNIRGIFVENLRQLLGNRYADFDKLNSIEYVLLFIRDCYMYSWNLDSWCLVVSHHEWVLRLSSLSP